MALAVASVVSTATAGACPASAIVEGPDALRDAANAALEAHAIATLPGAECPAIHARLSSRDGGVLVEVTDSAGRVSERQVTDAATAATWIESWARSDLDSMLLSAPPAGKVAQVEEREHPVPIATAVVPRVVMRGPAVRVAANAGPAMGSDGSLWLGVAALACVRFGAACAGVLGRLSQDTQSRGDSEAMETARTQVDLMVVVDVPRRHASWSWTPGAVLGLALDRSAYNPDSGMATMGTIQVDGGAIRAGVHLSVARQLGRRWSLGADVAFDAAVFSPADAADSAVPLAGPPRGFARGSLALQYEGS